MERLNHRFGDDGEFWMSFDDVCKKFQTIHRTRLFNHDWTLVQQWTSVHVSWVSGYLTTKFVIEVKKAGTVVVVLSQVSSRRIILKICSAVLLILDHSSTVVTLKGLKVSIRSIFTSSSKRKRLLRANIS